MKLTALAAVLAGSASYLQVSAAPIRILLVTSGVSTTTNTNPVANNSPAFEHLRFGHPVPNQAGPVAWLQGPHAAGPAGGGNKPVQHHRPCRGGRNRFHDRVKAKTLEIANFFRAALGWPLKEPAPHHHHGKHHHKHGKHHDDHDHHRHGKHHHHKGPEGKQGGPMSADVFTHHGKFEHEATSFGMRLHRALMSLGPWEGRAMAFVLGCGIGVLLRMFWVFAIVMIRVVGGNRTCQYIPVAVRAEDLMVPPPNYVFEDVKTPVVVGDVKTPVVLEEVKKTAEDESK
ncbi:hypothetical protein K443DRAFT_337558 [Laccaria amethystina LaAM-08-1]|uniref:Uncharacterized protein n=1 Tax=Laccaria amethystina LaAM-08-1 TaxID=1095629 RepID=A0A0C9XBK4_9AGAR|nr:hypothetical protein K443DRAFT_337558 [Laccaria amethystina LaAM-08-1]